MLERWEVNEKLEFAKEDIIGLLVSEEYYGFYTPILIPF